MIEHIPTDRPQHRKHRVGANLASMISRRHARVVDLCARILRGSLPFSDIAWMRGASPSAFGGCPIVIDLKRNSPLTGIEVFPVRAVFQVVKQLLMLGTGHRSS